MLRVPHHPREDLRRDARPRRATPAARAASRNWRGAREARTLPIMSVPSSGPTRCEPQRSCSLSRGLAVLVGADRDVLRAVVGGELGAAQRDGSGSEGRDRGDDLLARPGDRLFEPRAIWVTAAPAIIAVSTARPLERELRAGEPATHAAAAARSPPRGGPARARAGSLDLGRAEALELGRDLEPPVGQADRAGPGVRPVHEHAVRERHPAEPDRLLGHDSERSG